MHFLYYTQTVQFNSNHFIYASMEILFLEYTKHMQPFRQTHVQVKEVAQYDNEPQQYNNCRQKGKTPMKTLDRCVRRSKVNHVDSQAFPSRWLVRTQLKPLTGGQRNTCGGTGGWLIRRQRAFILPFTKRGKWRALRRCDSSWWKTTFTATLGNQTHTRTVSYQRLYSRAL